MRRTNCLTLVTAASFVLCWATACQVNTEPRGEAVNQPAAKTGADASSTNANLTAAPPAAADKVLAGSLATPAEAYKAAYAARQKKDVEGLKRMLSKDALEFFTTVAEADKKTVEDVLKQMAEKPQAPTAETRNEKIMGDRATLEYLDEKGKWKTMDFVKEGGGWKLTLPKAERPGAG
jgi:predicted lipid-binding transport protein (Tim44 family)